MGDLASTRALGRLLDEAARAHHDVFDGPDPDWPRWYAAFLAGDIDSHVGFSPEVEEIAGWLALAHERHQADARDQPWPDFFARVILDLVGENRAGV